MRHAAPPGWRLHVHDTLGSTQEEAIAAAQAGDEGRLAILAHLQTSGRGSRGRQWTGASGNLHLSTLLLPKKARPEPGAWALMAGLVLHDAVAVRLAKPEALCLKWPNDLLLDDAKLGGILIDSTLAADGSLEWVVIGFGLNIATAPHVEGRQVSCLAGLCESRQTVDWAADILSGLDRWAEQDFAAIRNAWLARAHPIGTWLEVAIGTERRAGAFDGLAADGSLLLAAQAVPVSTGDVFAMRGAN